MAHFAEQTWADFVRGIDDSGAVHEVQSHLASACPECEHDFDFWGRIVRLAASLTVRPRPCQSAFVAARPAHASLYTRERD